MNGNDWINDFVERLTNIEGVFEIFASLFLKYEYQFVFGLKSSKEWVEEHGKKKASLSAIGGRTDWSKNQNLIQFLKERCVQDVGIDVTIADSPFTYLDYQHRLKKIPIDLVRGETRPRWLLLFRNQGIQLLPVYLFLVMRELQNKSPRFYNTALSF